MKPSIANLAKLIYERDGVLYTNTTLLCETFGVPHSKFVGLVSGQYGELAAEQSLDADILPYPPVGLEMTCRGFEHLMFEPTRRLYWRSTFSRILKEFEREHLRRKSLGQPSSLRAETF